MVGISNADVARRRASLGFAPATGGSVISYFIGSPKMNLVSGPIAETLDALRRAHSRGARLVSICSGAFVLAATGLLDGEEVATHWRYAEALRRLHPRAVVNGPATVALNVHPAREVDGVRGLASARKTVGHTVSRAVAATWTLRTSKPRCSRKPSGP